MLMEIGMAQKMFARQVLVDIIIVDIVCLGLGIIGLMYLRTKKKRLNGFIRENRLSIQKKVLLYLQ